jgi:3-isopropylmalate dehydrogenase
VRELTGGIYFGKPSYREGNAPDRAAVDTASYTEQQIVDVLDFGFALARARRGHVTSVDKANVMNTSRLWREVAQDYAAAHPDVKLEHALVDSFAMALIQNPTRYDVVVTENLFGDILTDLAAVIAGSLGVLPSASLQPRGGSQRFGLYEPVHGSAPDIAGKGIANPAGTLLSVALMLRWSAGRPDLAESLETAVDGVMAGGTLTPDLGGTATTDSFVNKVITYLDNERTGNGRRDLRHNVA